MYGKSYVHCCLRDARQAGRGGRFLRAPPPGPRTWCVSASFTCAFGCRGSNRAERMGQQVLWVLWTAGMCVCDLGGFFFFPHRGWRGACDPRVLGGGADGWRRAPRGFRGPRAVAFARTPCEGASRPHLESKLPLVWSAPRSPEEGAPLGREGEQAQRLAYEGPELCGALPASSAAGLPCGCPLRGAPV